MAKLSPSTIAINAIAHCLANAIDASAGLDPQASEDLRALLRVAAGEVDRVRKANRKAASVAKKAASQTTQKPKTKSASLKSAPLKKDEIIATPAPKPVKARTRIRKTEVINSAASH